MTGSDDTRVAAQAPSPGLCPGDTVGGYVVEGEVGRGGMGRVYRARDEALERIVALKVIAPEVAADDRFRERFRREARMAARIEHPNVVPVYRAGQDGGRLYIAMRFVDAPDLGSVLSRDGRLRLTRAVELIAQLAGALDAAHALGLVHRDVKPANVLLDGDRAMLTDFGLTVERDHDAALTGTRHWVGTPAYAAPEQLRGAPVDARTDVYALAGLLHHCLTGCPPYPGRSVADVVSAHLSDPPPRPSVTDPAFAPFDEVIARGMGKDPAARFPTAGGLGRAAVQAAAGRGHTLVLPAQPIRLIGRDGELTALEDLLRRDAARLVTLTGPGGVGKTRLAIELAARIAAHGGRRVVFAGVAEETDARRLFTAIARGLDLREDPGRTVADVVAAYLAEEATVLVLDNFEQLMAAATDVAGLIGAVPSLQLVVTSREPLRVSGEREFPVSPLPEAAAVALFVERARAVRLDFHLTADNADAVREICLRLDGLPLALELAATRLRVLAPAALLERLSKRFSLLTGGPRDTAERQRTLQSAIEWSYRLLGADDQRAFAALAVFRGGFDLAAAEDVLGPVLGIDVLGAVTSLADKSLVVPPADDGRLRMLESLHDYAGERLSEMPQQSALRDAHARHFAGRASALDARLHGTGLDAAELAREHDNFFAALDWTATAGDVDLHLAMLADLSYGWWLHDQLTVARTLLERGVEIGVGADPRLRARTFGWLSYIAVQQGDIEPARQAAERSRALSVSLGDARLMANALGECAEVAAARGDISAARVLHEQALEIGRDLSPAAHATCLVNVAEMAILEGRPDLGLERAMDAARVADRAEFAHGRAMARSLASIAALASGDRAKSWGLATETLAIATRHGFREWQQRALEVAAACAEPADGVQLLAAVLAARDARRHPWTALEQCVLAPATAEILADARRLAEAGDAPAFDAALGHVERLAQARRRRLTQ